MSARRPYFFSAAFLGLLLSAAGQAQTTSSGFHSESPEDFRIEVTGSAWILNADGRPVQ